MARPDLSYLKNLFLFLLGLPFGILSGLTGIGSSIAVLPSVRLLLGLRLARAAGTALAVTFFAALSGVLSYQQHGAVRWGLAVLLTVGQIVGAAWGQKLVDRAPNLARLSVLWAILVAAGGIGMIYAGTRAHLPPGLWPECRAPAFLFAPTALLVSLLVGAVSRIMALGGVLLVPAAIFLLSLPPHAAQGTALVVLILASLPGMLIHARRGEVEPQSATWLSVGAVFGGLTGAFYAVRLPDHALVFVFGLALAILGVSMLWRKEEKIAPS